MLAFQRNPSKSRAFIVKAPVAVMFNVTPPLVEAVIVIPPAPCQLRPLVPRVRLFALHVPDVVCDPPALSCA